ncbi:MAG: hypothetical protein IJ048_07580, partial [Clostridia bacterium]|nr:hypothetical protein [Clostridia bacterium]
MELVEDIPAGLAAAFLNGEEAAVAAFSDERVRLRTAEPVEGLQSLSLFLLDFDRASYEEIAPQGAALLSCVPRGAGYVCEIDVGGGAWRQAARRALAQWARYI